MTPYAIAMLGEMSSRVTWPAIAGLLLQLTAIALVGHVGLLLARRGSAALRHLIALTALASMLVLPGLSALPKPWAAWSFATRWIPPAPGAEGAVSDGDTEAGSASAPAPGVSLSPRPVVGRSAPDVASDAGPAPRVSWTTVARQNLPAMLAVLVLLVAGLLLTRALLGLLAAAWAVSGASGAGDERLQRELEAACRRLGISRHVALTTTSRLGIPVVTGLLRPTLVLPVDAMAWSDERLRAVLLHELAHVLRGDAVSLMIGRVATSLFWFHPLAWTLARAMQRECERACDDVVLSSGLRPSDYADHLLSIARSSAGRRLPGLTLAFARTSSLEGRLLTVLRSDLRRGPASARVRLGLTLLALILVLPLSAIRVVGAVTVASGQDAGGAAEDRFSASEESKKSDVQESWKKEVKRETWKDTSSDDPSDQEDGPAALADAKSAAALYRRAKQLYDEERYREAGPAYEAAARGDYRPATSWYNAACSYALDSQKLRALGALQKAIDSGYDDATHIQQDSDLNSIRADARYKLMIQDLRHSDAGERQRDHAVEKYENLRDSGSDDASSWNSVGIELMRSGESELAIKAFQRRVGIDGSPSGIYNEACAEALDGQTNAALSALEQAIVAGFGGGKDKLTSDSDLASLRGSREFNDLVQLADDLTIDHPSGDDRDQDIWREQLPRYERTAEQHSNLGRAWFNLGYVQLRAGDAAPSRESFGRALDKGYRRPTTLYNLACCAAQVGDRDAAMRYLTQSESAGMNLWNATNDDDLRPLRSDPRFQAMVSRLERNLLQGKLKGNKGS